MTIAELRAHCHVLIAALAARGMPDFKIRNIRRHYALIDHKPRRGYAGLLTHDYVRLQPGDEPGTLRVTFGDFTSVFSASDLSRVAAMVANRGLPCDHGGSNSETRSARPW
jgi:hypothetical protein